MDCDHFHCICLSLCWCAGISSMINGHVSISIDLLYVAVSVPLHYLQTCWATNRFSILKQSKANHIDTFCIDRELGGDVGLLYDVFSVSWTYFFSDSSFLLFCSMSFGFVVHLTVCNRFLLLFCQTNLHWDMIRFMLHWHLFQDKIAKWSNCC